MTNFLSRTDAEMSAELDVLLAAPCASQRVTKKPLTAGQKRKIEAMSEQAMECDGDTVAIINRLLDEVIASLGNKSKHDARRTALNAVRHFHLPSLLDAYEVDTSRAH